MFVVWMVPHRDKEEQLQVTDPNKTSNWTSQSRMADAKKERRAVSFLLRGDKERSAAGPWWRVSNAHRRLNGVIESQHCDGINCFQITSVWTSGFKLGMDYVVYCSGRSRSLVSRCTSAFHHVPWPALTWQRTRPAERSRPTSTFLLWTLDPLWPTRTWRETQNNRGLITQKIN